MLGMAVALVGSFAVFFSAMFVLALIEELIQKQEVQSGLVPLGILAVLLWWSWLQLPTSIRKAIHDLLKRKDRYDRD